MSSVKLTYYGKVDPTGKIGIPKRSRAEIASEFVGQTVEVTIRKKRSYRTLPQNAYYWGVVVRIITKVMKEHAPDQLITNEDVHEYLKARFLPIVTGPAQIVLKDTGEVLDLPYSTRRLTKSEFSDYLTLVFQFAAETLNCIVPPAQQEFDGCDIDQKLIEREA